MAEELKLQRTREQWSKSDPKFMAKQSPAAIMYALQDAKRDIEALHRYAEKMSAQLPSQGGEAVAYRHTLHMDAGQSHSVVSESEHHPFGVRGENFDDAYSVTTEPLYTHPAGQVAKPDAELVELLRSKFPRIDPCQPVPLDEKAHCCEYTIYVERERLHRIIDAKLSSLK